MTTADLRAAEVATRQHGIVTRDQLVALGASARTIARRVESGRWQLVGRGVYLLGGFEATTTSRLMAAALYVPGSVASHVSAGRLHGLEPLPPDGQVDDLSAVGRRQRRGDWFRMHRVTQLDAIDMTTVDGIPCTTIPRTIVDLAGVLRPQRYGELVDQALTTSTSLDEIEATLDRLASRGRPGIQQVRGLIEERGGQAVSTSELEQRFVRLVRAQGLPEPVSQWLPPWCLESGIGRVDFAYPKARLVIEVDGRRWHTTSAAFESDRRRDQEAAAAGWTTLRFTWSDITDRPDFVAQTIRACLANTRAA